MKKSSNQEPHLPLPYQKGNTIIAKYTSQKIINGTIYQTEMVDFLSTDKKGNVSTKIGYPLRNWTTRTEYSHLNTSDLNNMSIDDIISHQMMMIDKFYDYDYVLFLSNYITRRINQLLNNKPFYV